MPAHFGTRSLARLNTCHPDLVRLFLAVAQASPFDLVILEGVRTPERQRALFNQGASSTMRSRHLPHPRDQLSRAVDVAPWIDGATSWHWPLYHKLARTVKAEAARLGIPIEWGGDWRTFKDGPHWQLPWREYP